MTRQLLSAALISIALVAGACAFDASGESLPLVQRASLSDCGGFDRDSPDPGIRPANYCQAERLSWTYDAETETLELIDRRILLNCCGDRGVSASLAGGLLVVTETDAPENQDMRCGCMCTYDISLTLVGVPLDSLTMLLVREVTDDGADEEVIWEGDLDLARGRGSAVIDTGDAGIWCD